MDGARYLQLLLTRQPHTSNPPLCHRDTSTESISLNSSSVAMIVRDQARSCGQLEAAVCDDFKRLGTDAAEMAMASGSIVERLDVVGHGAPGRAARLREMQ